MSAAKKAKFSAASSSSEVALALTGPQKRADAFFCKYALLMDQFRDLDRAARELYERHVLLGLLDEERTGKSMDLGAANTLDDCLTCLQNYNKDDFKTSLKKDVDEGASSKLARASISFLDALTVCDVTKSYIPDRAPFVAKAKAVKRATKKRAKKNVKGSK